MISAIDIQDFWFIEADREGWFLANDAFDAQIKERFTSSVESALSGEYSDWNNNFSSRLSLILLLDQFPRNIYRGSSKAFSGDAMALSLTMNVITEGQLDSESDDFKRVFLLLPMMHSEDLKIQERSIPLFERYTGDNTITYANLHLDIIKRFGRFPHRNLALGRESTPEELEFLQQPNSSF